MHADARGASTQYEQMAWFLEAHFGEVELRGPEWIVRVEEEEARVHLESSVVSCANGALGERVKCVVEMAALTVRSLADIGRTSVL